MLQRITEKIAGGRRAGATKYQAGETYDDSAQEEYRRWQGSPEGLVIRHLMDMDREQLRYIRREVDRELDERDDRDRTQAAIGLDNLTRTLAEHKGCPVGAVHFSDRTLAEARAAVERGEIMDVSDYIPY